MEKLEKVLELVDSDILKDMVQECNSWNGSLEDYVYYENDDYFFDDYFCDRPAEAVRAAYYGDYNYMDEMVRFNAYGNLDSCSTWEYEQELEDAKEEIVETFIDLYEQGHVTCYDSEIQEILDEEDEDDEGD